MEVFFACSGATKGFERLTFSREERHGHDNNVKFMKTA